MRNPQPFTVYQSTPGQTFPKPLFTIHAYSIEQARAIVAAKVAGETIVVAIKRDGSDIGNRTALQSVAAGVA